MAKARKYRPICDLVPYERAAVRAAVEKYKAAIMRNLERGKPGDDGIDPVRVLPLDDICVVTDGNNRVKAFLECGLSDVPVIEEWKSPQDEKPYRAAAEEHKALRGFTKLPLVGNEGQRQSLPTPESK